LKILPQFPVEALVLAAAVRAAFVRLVVGNVPRRKPGIEKGRKEVQLIVIDSGE